MTEYNGHMTENTNMMVELLANSAKLKPEEERWHFDKNLDDEMDDNFNNYVTHNDIPMNTNQSENFNAYNNTEKHYSDNNANFNNDTSAPQANNVHQSTNKFIDDEYEILSPLEKRLRRLDMMRALGELRDLGCKVTNYNIDDDYYMMKYELDLHRSIRSKRNWLGLYSHMMIGAIKGIELLNNNYNPFDFSLKGLSDEVNADKKLVAVIYCAHLPSTDEFPIKGGAEWRTIILNEPEIENPGFVVAYIKNEFIRFESYRQVGRDITYAVMNE